MIRRSVVLKLFVVTSALILIIFSLALAAEALFFEKFYRATKIGTMEKQMNAFAEQYAQTKSDDKRLSRLLGEFMNKHDAITALLNDKFSQMSIQPYFLELESGGKVITVVIPLEGMTIEDIPTGIKRGMKLEVEGIFMDERDTVLHPINFRITTAQPEQGLVRVRGTVMDLLLPERRSFNPYDQNSLVNDALRGWRPLNLQQYRSSAGGRFADPLGMDGSMERRKLCRHGEKIAGRRRQP